MLLMMKYDAACTPLFDHRRIGFCRFLIHKRWRFALGAAGVFHQPGFPFSIPQLRATTPEVCRTLANLDFPFGGPVV